MLDVARRFEVLLVVGAPWLGVSRTSRVLAAAGCRIVLLCHPRRFAARSRFVDEVVPAPRSATATLPVLKRLLAERRFDWVILGDDLVLSEAVRDEAAWREGWFPIDPRGDASRLLLSKTAFAAAMTRERLPFPVSEVARGPGEAAAAAERVGYPIIVKPDESAAGAGLFRAESARDLERVPPGAAVVVQRYVEGDVGSTSILFRAGRPLCWMSSYKEHVYPPPFGPSCVRRYAHFPGLEQRLHDLGALLGMTGLCGVDWIHEPGATDPLFLEFNGRPTPWLHLCRDFGVDFPAAIRAMLAGEPTVVRPPATVPVPLIRMFPQDPFRAVSQGDWRGFARGFLGRETPSDVPRDDPRLLRAFRGYLLKRAWARVRGRAR